MIDHDLLSAMKQVEVTSNALQTTSWIWGGLTLDIYQGYFMRSHHDLDLLTLQLHELVGPLTDRFQADGWQVRRLSNGDLELEKDSTGVQLGNVSFSREVRWTHNGDIGSLFFPRDWLSQQSRRFYDVEIHVVAPEFQYVLLSHPELLNPQWVLREKDIAARARLKTILETDGITVSKLRTMVHN